MLNDIISYMLNAITYSNNKTGGLSNQSGKTGSNGGEANKPPKPKKLRVLKNF